MRPDLAGDLGTDAFAAEAASLLKLGATLDEMPDALDATVQRRHGEFVELYLAGALRSTPEAEALARVAEWVVTSADPGAEGDYARYRLAEALDGEPAEQERVLRAYVEAEAAATYRRSAVLDGAERSLYGHTPAEPRRDMDPRLAALLGMDPHRCPGEQEIAHLLNGLRADGADIEGKAKQRATASLETALRLDPERQPTWDEVSHILAGRRADGGAVDAPGSQTARARFLRLMGVAKGEPDETQARNLLYGRMADGGEVDAGRYRAGVEASKSRIAYIDLTFAPHKSVSVAWAFAPTEAERHIIAQAHKDAVDAAMRFVARELGHVTKGRSARLGTEPGELAWFGLDHYASRPTLKIARTSPAGERYTELAQLKAVGDPQLHTHTILLNVTLGATGRVGAIDFDRLAGRVPEFGAFYHACLATNLRRSGVDMVLDERTGLSRLAAVPERIWREFSKRTEDGNEAAREYAKKQGLDWDSLSGERQSALVKQSAHFTRRSKKDASEGAECAGAADFAAWKRQAKALGYEHRSVLRPDAVVPAPSRDERLETAREAALPLVDKALQRRAKLDSRELRVMAARGLIASGVESPDDISAIVRSFANRGVRQNGEITTLMWGEDVPVRGKARIGVTTALHETAEQELCTRLHEAHKDRSAALSSAAVQAAAARSGLDFTGAHGEAQHAAMMRLGTGGRFGTFIGVAGSGKSSVLRPLVDAWRADGRQVYGAALAWRQTEALADAGIAGRDRAALDVFLKRAAAGKIALDRNSVVVVDEIGMVGTRQLLDLMRLQDQHGFQVVAVGDPRQCAAVEAGPVVALMERALGAAAIPAVLTTLRQRTQEERDTSLMFRKGRAAEALDIKRQNGTALLVPGDRHAAAERVAKLWRERTEAGAEVTVSAPTNADARLVAAAIRETRRDMGLLGQDRVKLDAQDQGCARYELPLAVGDRVRLFDRVWAHGEKHGPIGSNGEVLDVREIREHGLLLRNAAGRRGDARREGFVPWTKLQDRQTGRIRLAPGDALTIDAVQGSTSGTHILALPNGSQNVNGFKGYVAASRHRDAFYIVTSDGAERQEIYRRRPMGDPRPIGAGDVWANIGRNLSRQPEKASALAFLERAAAVRRGTIRNVQAGLHARERLVHPPPRPVMAPKKRNVAAERLAAILPALREVAAQTVRAADRAVEQVQERRARMRM